MKHMARTAVFTISLLSFAHLEAAQSVANYFSIRSQGFDTARKVAGITNLIDLPDQQKPYGALWSTISYGQNFRPNAISSALFGEALTCCDDCAYFTVSGSAVANRGEHDLLADYFGLPTNFQSRVALKPRIENFVFDNNFYLGLDEWTPGLYFSIQAPIVHSRWDLNMCETVLEPGSGGYQAGYFSPDAIANGNLLDRFTDFASNCQAPEILDSTLSCSTIVFQPLSQARLNPCRDIKTRVAELSFTLGWNFFTGETDRADYHAGMSIHTSSPTGTTPKARYLFEPMVGNGHHWTFGGSFTGHYDWHIGETDEQSLGFYIDLKAEHLFKSHQRRTYDLAGKPLSRYMLAQKLQDNSTSDPRLASTFPAQEFAYEYTPVANLTTLDVDVSVGVQADLLAMGTYTRNGFTCDLGYEFWGRTTDNVSLACAYPSELEKENYWALKGDAYTVGFESGTTTPVRLAAIERDATIYQGTNTPVATVAQPVSTNPGIDYRADATSNNSVAVNDILGNRTGSSSNIHVLTIKDIDLHEGRTKGSSHKVFTHIGHTWFDHEGWIPFVGIGAEVEFGARDCSCKTCTTTCSSNGCPSGINTALTQWQAWFKGGIAF